MTHRLQQRYGRSNAGCKIVAHSDQRYNGGVRIKRQYGSSTITVFYVYFASDDREPSKWEKIEGFGKTPGERKTYVMNEFRRRHPR